MKHTRETPTVLPSHIPQDSITDGEAVGMLVVVALAVMGAINTVVYIAGILQRIVRFASQIRTRRVA